MKILLLLLVPALSFAQLSGNYIIGSSQPAPFNKLTSAVAHLNTQGASGAVTFLLDNAEYSNSTGETFPITIKKYPGNSAARSLTIKPNAGRNVVIRANNVNSWTPTPAVFELQSANYLTIDGSNNASMSINMTIENTNALAYSKRTVIFVSTSAGNGASHNAIKNVNLVQQSHLGSLSMGIFAGGSSVGEGQSQAAMSNNTVSNVTFTKTGQGIYVDSGSSQNLSNNWTIQGCRFGAAADDDKGFLGIYLNNVSNYTIADNIIDGLRKSTYDYNPIHAGIYITGISHDGSILRNNITNLRDFVGSQAVGIFNTGNNTLIANNMVNNIRAQGNGGLLNNGFGIVLSGGANVRVLHNTVRLAPEQTSGPSAAIMITSGTGLDIRNNILVNPKTSGSSRYAIYSQVAASNFEHIDHNNYFSNQQLGYLGGNTSNLNQWKSATGKDANSVSINPPFVSGHDLHINQESTVEFDNLGIWIDAVQDDIDNEARALVPDIGADEFVLPKCIATTTWTATGWSNGTPNIETRAVINAHYNTDTNSFKCCELIVNPGFSVTIQPGDYIEAQHDIAVNGTMLVKDKGSLIQNDRDAVHTGIITVKRKTTPLKQYDFTYWASPVTGAALSVLASPSHYYLFDPVVNNYVAQTAAAIMSPGRGYIARAPGNLSYATPQIVEATFTGVPNTGTVPVVVNKSGGAFNLIGNPYPSAIDADIFLTDPENAQYIGGTIYLWTHNTAISMHNSGNHLYNYTRDDYAKYNVTGGVKTAIPAVSSSVAPVGKIASGQGFFVEALQTGNHEIYFRNSMRAKGHNNNSQFFKGADENALPALEKNRIWLSISNAQQAYDEMLLGYITGATNALDRAYDGKTFPAGNVVAIYSLLDEQPLAIQGRALPFDAADAVPLGYTTAIAGTFKISLEQFDGFFENQEVYLVDKSSGIYHNLRMAPFEFETGATTNNDRFELRFMNPALGTPSQIAHDGVRILAKNKKISIRSGMNIRSVEIFEMSGKNILNVQNVGSKEFESAVLPVSGTAVLVIATFDDNRMVSKKIVIIQP